MQYLTEEQLHLIHIAAIDETGGSHGIRDHTLIASAAALPRQAAFGAEMYPGVFDKAAVYARSIIANHPFIDGNKRAAILTAGTFLSLNGYELDVAEGELHRFAHKIIAQKLEVPDIAEWLEKNSVKA